MNMYRFKPLIAKPIPNPVNESSDNGVSKHLSDPNIDGNSDKV